MHPRHSTQFSEFSYIKDSCCLAAPPQPQYELWFIFFFIDMRRSSLAGPCDQNKSFLVGNGVLNVWWWELWGGKREVQAKLYSGRLWQLQVLKAISVDVWLFWAGFGYQLCLLCHCSFLVGRVSRAMLELRWCKVSSCDRETGQVVIMGSQLPWRDLKLGILSIRDFAV